MRSLCGLRTGVVTFLRSNIGANERVPAAVSQEPLWDRHSTACIIKSPTIPASMPSVTVIRLMTSRQVQCKRPPYLFAVVTATLKATGAESGIAGISSYLSIMPACIGRPLPIAQRLHTVVAHDTVERLVIRSLPRHIQRCIFLHARHAPIVIPVKLTSDLADVFQQCGIVLAVSICSAINPFSRSLQQCRNMAARRTSGFIYQLHWASRRTNVECASQFLASRNPLLLYECRSQAFYDPVWLQVA